MKKLFLFSIVGLAALVSCNNDEDVTVSSEIKIAEGETIQMTYGETMQLHANRYPDNSISSIKEWSSSAPNVASVTPLGNVTAIAEGEATITISTVDDLSASCRVVVTAIATEKITLDAQSLEITVGESKKLKATISPDNASYKNSLTFTSSDASIATVGQDGEIKALKVGECQIEVTSPDGKKAVCDLEVTPIKVTDITLKVSAEQGISIKKGENYTVEVSVVPANATNKNLKWSTSDASIATVADGVVTGVAAGTATITVKSEGEGKFSKSFTVTVTE